MYDLDIRNDTGNQQRILQGKYKLENNANHSNQSVAKALQIIEVLSKARSSMRLGELAGEVGMPSSTVLRMIATLMEYGYVGQEPDTSKYYLTLKFAQIGSLVSARFSIRDVARSSLVDLSKQSGEATCIAVDEGMRAVYIDVVDGPDGMLKIMQYIGKQSPLHCTGVGKCLLLNYSEKQIDEWVKSQRLLALTPNTITSKTKLLKELESVRKNGYALDDEECELGARCIACGIRDYSGKTVAAISVSGPVNRMTMDYVKEIQPFVLKTANDISSSFAYEEGNLSS